MKWINFYGPPLSASGEYAEKMKRDPAHASQWAGRCLVQYFTERDVKYPVFTVSGLGGVKDEKAMEDSKDWQVPLKYHLVGEIGEAIGLPDSKRYSIMVRVGRQKFHIKPQEQRNNYIRFDNRFERTFETNYRKLKYFPTVFVYLMDGDEPICYFREEMSYFTVKNGNLD